jgi:hypothetical protein
MFANGAGFSRAVLFCAIAFRDGKNAVTIGPRATIG